MAYTINKTDGSILATVADGQVDKLSTDITLIGKNYSGFGEALNENLVKMLEHFAGTASPSQPIRGQLWFDSSELKLKVYNGSSFQPVSSATISTAQPLTLGAGDLWFNDIENQLYFYDGLEIFLIGPAYSASQGLSGLRVQSILDSLNQTRVITGLYVGGVLLGIFSKDTFTPKLPITGFTGNILTGFTAGTLAGLKFDVTVTNAEQLGGEPATSYVRNDKSNFINGQLSLINNDGLVFGAAGTAQLYLSDGDIVLVNTGESKNINFSVRKSSIQEDALTINALNRNISLYGGISESSVNVGGNLVVAGNLTVEGTTTTVNSTNLVIEDATIELAVTPTPTDAYADGGGIVLKGATDHTLIWTVSSAAWNSSEHVNLAEGKSFKINGIEVLSGSRLGSGITEIPGVTSFGPQTQLTVDDMYHNENSISITATDTDLILEPNGTGSVNVSGKKIINLPDGSGDAYAGYSENTDAASKGYVDYRDKGRALVFSMDLSDGISNSAIAVLLEQLAPVSEYRIGTRARILCTIQSNSSTYLNVNNELSPPGVTEFNTPGGGTAFGISSIAFNPASGSSPNIPAASISVSRVIKTFEIQTPGVWAILT